MKVYYTVHYEGVVEIDDEEWNDLKEDYNGDKEHFAHCTVSEEIREFNTEAITITRIEQ
jgi:hypothetical protein